MLFYCRSKGDCARKLKKGWTKYLLEFHIHKYIKTSKTNQEIKPVFDNKPALKRITASKVWERI